MARAEAYLHASFILIRPTVWPQCTNVTDRTDRQDRQRTDSTGRTVLQTVAQKRFLPLLSNRCPVLSVCNVGALWPNCWTDQNETWHAGRPRRLCPGWRPHCWIGIQLPPRKGAQQPPHSKFTGAGFACVRIIRGLCLLWPSGWTDQDAIWYGGDRRWPRPHYVI